MHLNKIKRLLRFIGRQGQTWLFLGTSSALLLGTVEYGVAGFIQLLMVNIGLMDASKLPEFAQPFADIGMLSVCLILVGIGVVKATAQFLTKQSSSTFNSIINNRLRLITLYEILIGRNDKFIPASEINLRFSEIFPKAGNFVSALTNCLVASGQTFLMFCGMMVLAWRETLIGLVGLFFIALIVKKFQNRIYAVARGVVVEQEHITKGIERISRNWLFVRISRTQNFEYEKAVNQVLRYFNHLSRSDLFTKLSANLPPLLGTILLAVIIYISQKYFTTKETNLLAFLYLFIRFVQQMSGLVDGIGGTKTYYPQFIKSFELFESFSENEMKKALDPTSDMYVFKEKKHDYKTLGSRVLENNVELEEIPSIEVSDMGFQWSPDGEKIFENFSLSIEAKTSIGISGHSGCGKSTLLMLLLGIVRPSSGCVKVGGLDANVFLEKYGHQIGYVGADPFLIHGTIRENLLYGKNGVNVDDDALWEALEKARLDQAIKGMNEGLNYCLSENGDGLSSGQKQRLSIARALLRNPKLLILDEASANLDNATEHEIAKTLKEISKECTLVIVSHRAGLIKYVDNELKLDELQNKRMQNA
tara:strand:- start:15192 stop:16961 length:1770 start_codon:yes stop_codon:yes gene_type:complete